MKFAFIAKHRGIWPAEWLCQALGVSRGGFYAWLTRPRSERSRNDEEIGAKVRASFLSSDRTYRAGGSGAICLRKGVIRAAPDRAIDAPASASGTPATAAPAA